MPKSKPVVRARSSQDRARIIAIAEQIVTGQIQAGEFDPADDTALRTAVRKATVDAHAAFYAAIEFIGG